MKKDEVDITSDNDTILRFMRTLCGAMMLKEMLHMVGWFS
jgi:hypothetical protein